MYYIIRIKRKIPKTLKLSNKRRQSNTKYKEASKQRINEYEESNDVRNGKYKNAIRFPMYEKKNENKKWMTQRLCNDGQKRTK